MAELADLLTVSITAHPTKPERLEYLQSCLTALRAWLGPSFPLHVSFEYQPSLPSWEPITDALIDSPAGRSGPLRFSYISPPHAPSIGNHFNTLLTACKTTFLLVFQDDCLLDLAHVPDKYPDLLIPSLSNLLALTTCHTLVHLKYSVHHRKRLHNAYYDGAWLTQPKRFIEEAGLFFREDPRSGCGFGRHEHLMDATFQQLNLSTVAFPLAYHIGDVRSL